jgi:CRP-like cAMP-binding protein
MGAQNALSHFAHFTCEMYGRLKAAGRVQQLHFTLPMTQTELGDTLGLSAVHTNRVLQELRGKRLLSWTGNEVQILDWDRLREVAMFDPTYLSSWQEPR